MNKVLIPFVLFYSFFYCANSQDTLTYKIAFPNATHHEAEISLEIANVQADNLTALMSKSSPGRYGIHHFAKNIYKLKATGSNNASASIRRLEAESWDISGFGGQVRISYTLFANYANGTYSGIDANFANLNMPSTLLWIKQLTDIPIKVIFDLPAGSDWKIATQLSVIDSAKHIYGAPNLQYLMDSPCKITDINMKSFTVGENDKYQIRMALDGENNDEEIQRFVNMTKAVVNEQEVIFGEFPLFRDSIYTFLCSYGPGYHGDAMEHRNSTLISSPIMLAGNQQRLIGSISHEFFHCWNVERIRPSSLEPFDFTKANLSGELWFGEGFTNYYGGLTLCRAGITEEQRYIGSISKTINYALNTPGIYFGSPVEMSEMAPFTDRVSGIDEDNFFNTYLSYYTYGEIIALALDLSLRTEFEQVSLDNLMLAMWKKYGRSETPYANIDIQNTLAEICGSTDFAQKFFQNYIFGTEIPDFESLFDKLGYKLIKKNPNKPSIGFVRMKFEGDTATLLSQPLINTALYEAGVNKGDLILSIDDQFVTSYPELNFIIGTRKINDEIEVKYSHHGKLKVGSFKLKEDNQLVLIPKERFSIKLKDEELELRTNWLKSRVKQ